MSTTTSEPEEAFVWVWLPDAMEPVVAGRLEATGDLISFNYGRSYLARPDAIPLYLPELPLEPGRIEPLPGLTLAGCIRDAAPDAWGRRVVMRHVMGRQAAGADPALLGPLTYLLLSGSDRTGAIDFQERSDVYVGRDETSTPLGELMAAADAVAESRDLPPALDLALLHGSSIGGAKPKATLSDGTHRGLIAKFSSTTDTYPVVKGEFIAMRIARRAGLRVAEVELAAVLGRDILLVERFDRVFGTGQRRAMVSALTMLGLDEMMARYASYADLAQVVRARFVDSRATLRELFTRVVFNILVGNNDDHARNHAAFWDGSQLELTPAFDICPQPRSGGETAQAMIIGADGFHMSQLAGCVERAGTYMLSQADAKVLVDRCVDAIRDSWAEVCDEAALTRSDRAYFWGRQFLNPYAFEEYSAPPVTRAPT